MVYKQILFINIFFIVFVLNPPIDIIRKGVSLRTRLDAVKLMLVFAYKQHTACTSLYNPVLTQTCLLTVFYVFHTFSIFRKAPSRTCV